MGELRWILMAIGGAAIIAVWWWSTRRSTQAPGDAELRESTVVPAATLASGAGESQAPERRPPPAAADQHPPGEKRSPQAERHRPPEEHPPAAEKPPSPARGVAPFEPLSIHTTDFDSVPALDQPMMVRDDALDLTVDLGQETLPAAPLSQALHAPPSSARSRASDESDRLAPAAPQAPNFSEKQKIVTVRVCAVGEARWSGADLMSTLEGHGLAYGRYQVYHRKHNDGHSVFCVASLVEPGTFDIAHMAEEQFRGVSLFAVLPGPIEPMQTVDALLSTARDLARELSGTVQDAKGTPFSAQRAAALREDVARFQASLS
jgi:cell division protein ZipA